MRRFGGRYLISSGETESDVYGWLYFDLRWPEWGLSQSTAERGLTFIGILAGIIAIALFGFRLPFAAAYMGVWGLVTAASRILALGSDAWPEAVLRVANGGAPIVILIFLLSKHHSAQTHS